ncbi:MAG: TonB-dependent receptor [Chlorobi bacterium]|nr:TonB-dependent receptor [Chlorobiota bacterium]
MRKVHQKAIALVFALALVSFVNLMAQKVSGKVTDENGSPLPGAAIVVVGTTYGTTTDVDGNYHLLINEDEISGDQYTLSINFIGYKIVEKTFQKGSDYIWNVQLEPDIELLKDVVVIGYGTVKKEDATGSVTAISSKDFNPGAIASPQDLLVGKTSGVQITSSGGAPGSGAMIRIRGGSSMSASNDPLIIIDGVPMATDGVAGMRNPLNTINPNDIETFTILKDASATAIYGSRASNGVIIITTKKGKAGKLQFNYVGNVSVSSAAGEVDVMDADQYRSFVTDMYGEGSPAVNLLGNANTDWQDEIFRTSVSTDHNFSASGSIAKALPFRASIGYSNQNGILETSKLERYTGALNLNPSFFDDYLKIAANVKLMQINNTFANGGAVGSAVVFDPTQPVYTESYPGDRSYGGYTTWTDANGLPIPIAPFNPVAMLDMHDDQSDVWRYILSAKVDYKLHFMPSVTATLNMAVDGSSSDGSIYEPVNAPWTYQEEGDQLVGGADNQYTQDKTNKLLDFYLTWSPDLGEKHSLKVMGGYSWQHFYREGWSKNSNVNNDPDRTTESSYKSENYLVSFMGRLEYNLLNRYLFTFTAREDGSSRFVDDNKWGFFPAGAFAWRINNEAFMENAEVVSDLKLRLGWGVTGQQDITGSDYPALALYTQSQNTNALYPWGSPNNWIYTMRPEDYDPNLKWEETETYNIGLDFGFMRQRLTGSIDLYYRETTNLINTIPLAAGGLKNIRTTNVGSLTNQGIEFAIDYKLISNHDMMWSIGGNYTYNENEITKLTNVDDPEYLGVETGGISGGVGSMIQIHSVGYPTYSFFVYEQVYDENGNPLEGVYVDRNQDGVINNFDKYHYKQAAPKHMIGLNTHFEYKNLDFSASGRIQLGNYVYNNNMSDKGIRQNTYNSTGFLSNRLVSAAGPTGFNDYQYWSDMYVQDASFFRMDNMSVGYNFKDLYDGKVNLRVSLTGQNLFVITDYTGLDPEVAGGIDNNFYPRPRTFVFGVNLGF